MYKQWKESTAAVLELTINQFKELSSYGGFK